MTILTEVNNSIKYINLFDLNIKLQVNEIPLNLDTLHFTIQIFYLKVKVQLVI